MVIDCHVHFGAPGEWGDDCYWSDKFERTAAYYVMMALSHSFHKPRKEDMKAEIITSIKNAKYIDKCVLLALDEVYNFDGELKREDTHLHVSNDYLAGIARENEEILFGASVHPYRKDALDELERCKEMGAVLCKWIPSSQIINPANLRCDAIYRKLADLDLPLLCHTGPEYAVPTSNDDYNDYNNPELLRKALDAGITVIVAHCGLPYFGPLDYSENKRDHKAFFRLVDEADREGWKLYGDVSAFSTPSRIPYIKKLMERIPQERLIYGSDYPLPPAEFSFKKSDDLKESVKSIINNFKETNPFDKNYILTREMGFGDVIFENTERLLIK